MTSLIQWMWTVFVPMKHFGGDHTQRYYGLDRQGGCENILEGLVGLLVGLMTMMEGRREGLEAGNSLAD